MLSVPCSGHGERLPASTRQSGLGLLLPDSPASPASASDMVGRRLFQTAGSLDPDQTGDLYKIFTRAGQGASGAGNVLDAILNCRLST